MPSFAELPIRIMVLQGESNLDANIRWLEYIAGPEFVDDWKKSLQTGSSMQEMIKSARQIVEEHIYAFNTTDGTGRIKKSFTGKYLDTALPAFAIYSNPSIAPSKVPAGEWSYAAFFEDPKFNTFLPPKDNPYDSRRYRPFFDAMTKAQQVLSLQAAFRSLLRTIKRRMPKV